MKEVCKLEEGEETRVLQEMEGSPARPEVDDQLNPRQQENPKALIT